MQADVYRWESADREMSVEDAAPGTGIPGQRLDQGGNGANSSALIFVRNTICESARTYVELQLDVRQARPRLLPEAIDHALGELIRRGEVRLAADMRWAPRWL